MYQLTSLMRTFQSIPKMAWLFIVVCFVILGACKKNLNNDIPVVLNTDEYIRYSINASGYGFEMPIDKVIADTSLESQTFLPRSSVVAQRIPLVTSDFVRINYAKENISVGSQQKLIIFAAPQMDVFPYLSSSPGPVMIQVTEYGAIGEYISGTFSSIFTANAAGNQTYLVNCQFRVKRNI